MTAPEDFEDKHRTFNAPTLRDVGSRVGDALLWGVFGNPVLGRYPPRNPPSWPRRGVCRGVYGQEPPPFLDPLLGDNPPSYTLPMTLPVPRQ